MSRRGMLLVVLATVGCAHHASTALPPLPPMDPCPAPQLDLAAWHPATAQGIPATFMLPPEFRADKRPSKKMKYTNFSWRRKEPDSLVSVLTAVVEPPRAPLGARDPRDPSSCVETLGGHPLLIQTSFDPTDFYARYVTIAYWYITPTSGVRFYGYAASASGQRTVLAVLRTISPS